MPLFTLIACLQSGDPAGPDVVEDAGTAPRPRFDAEAPPEWLPPETPPLVDPDAEVDEDPARSAFLWEEGAITDLAIAVDAASMARLEADGADEVHARLTHGDLTLDVGLRLKGNITRRTFAGKPSLKIDAHAWLPNQRFHGLRRLTLNNMVQDKSMLKEHVVYRLYRDLGVPAPRHGYARVTINGLPYGLYGIVESMDQQFIDAWWPEDDEGNLYEGGYGADLADGRVDAFTVQEDGVPAAPQDLEALVAALDAATPETLHATLNDRFDFTATLDSLAVDLVSGNWDAYARAANNFLLYHAPEADRWSLVPWGQDQAFNDLYVPVHAGWEGRVLVLCGRSASCSDALYDRVAGVLDAWAGLPEYAGRVAEAVAADCEADPRAEIPCSPDDVLDFLAKRPAIVREELGERRAP